MKVEVRHATLDDLHTLVRLYRGLELEMTALHGMWPIADGLDEPAAASFEALLAAPQTYVVLGVLEDVPFGFMTAQVTPLLEQADGEAVGLIRFVYVEEEARQVGIGEAMRDEILGALRERGLTKFDALVLPGHRLAKNFFESGGFSARSIVMHHDDRR